MFKKISLLHFHIIIVLIGAITRVGTVISIVWRGGLR